MRLSRFKANSDGFTLIEILVALTIMSIALGVIFGALRLGIRSWEKGNETAETAQRQRMVLDLVTQDVKSAFMAERSQVVVFEGTQDELRFFTTTKGLGLGYNISGPRPVSYYLKEDDGLYLKEGYPWAPDDQDIFEEGEEYLLDPDITSIRFRYYGGASSGESEWVEVWDSKQTKRLPAAVEIEVTYGDGDGQTAAVVVPTNVDVESKVTQLSRP